MTTNPAQRVAEPCPQPYCLKCGKTPISWLELLCRECKIALKTPAMEAE